MQSVTINRMLMDNPGWKLHVYEYYENWYAVLRDGLNGRIEYSSSDCMSPIQAMGNLEDRIKDAEHLRQHLAWQRLQDAPKTIDDLMTICALEGECRNE